MFRLLTDHNICTRTHFQEEALTEAQQINLQLKKELEEAKKSAASTPIEGEKKILETTEEAEQKQVQL